MILVRFQRRLRLCRTADVRWKGAEPGGIAGTRFCSIRWHNCDLLHSAGPCLLNICANAEMNQRADNWAARSSLRWMCKAERTYGVWDCRCFAKSSGGEKIRVTLCRFWVAVFLGVEGGLTGRSLGVRPPGDDSVSPGLSQSKARASLRQLR